MGVTLTAPGQALIARLQAQGQPLIIDTFMFAYIDGQDFTPPPSTTGVVPQAQLVHTQAIPPEFRAYVNPNQVVYSALLGSDIGDFSFNWQGLYCAEHNTLVAVATFPALQKKAYNPNTNTPGNNFTRNFMLEFSGAQEITHITVEAAVWQLDFTVRLKGIDERERLSNRDIYGRAQFLADGWRFTRQDSMYAFTPGVGYVEGIRAALEDPMVVAPATLPCDVYLDVCMEPQGSDVVTVVQTLFVPEGEAQADYTTQPPVKTRHYVEKVAHINGDGSIEDTRPKTPRIVPQGVLGGGGELVGDVPLTIQPGEENTILTTVGGQVKWVPGKVPLSADLVLYVRAYGDDTNSGDDDTQTGAVATINRAMAILGEYNGMGIYSATINIGAGVFHESIAIGAHSSMGFTSLVFQGKNADSTKITASRDDFTIYALAAMNVTFKNITVAGDTTIAMVGAYYYASLSFIGCRFVGPSRICLRARSAEISLYGNTKISGAFTESVFSLAYAAVAILWDAFEVAGSAKCFVAISDFSVFTTCHTYLATFSGAFTATRFVMGPAAHIYSGGRGANFLPGNVAGTVPANQYCIYS
ncbi:phage tail-collar fiber domain-containing protein [Desulfovibrio cuneatus]|uniref:phage tail-collar fiber domain-containing protein n=1 Tax=Desulfovibrio cuneatus TaxID=159728 RepID=UPI0004299DFA|nr:phage tail protein [Desulfovibrio cuneatus]